MTTNNIKQITYKGVKILVSNRGKIYRTSGEEVKQHNMGGKNKYWFCTIYNPRTQKQVLVNVARAVCMAFHPIEGEDYTTLQADHIDCNPNNNVQSNLRWLSRDSNNGRKHAKMMREINRKLTRHPDEFVKGVNEETGETRYFKNGKQTAKEIGCSSPLVYMVLEGQVPTACGWTLKYISREAEEVQEFKKRLEDERKAKSDALKRAVEKTREERRLVKAQLKMKRAELRKHLNEELRKLRKENKRQLQEAKEAMWNLHAVQQYTLEGEFVNEFKNAYTAMNETGVKGIYEAINKGSEGGIKGGYLWKYKVPREVIYGDIDASESRLVNMEG